MALGGIIFIVIFIALFGSFLVWLSIKTGGKVHYHPVKYEPYECGLPSLDKKDTKVSVKYYLTAILFILSISRSSSCTHGRHRSAISLLQVRVHSFSDQ